MVAIVVRVNFIDSITGESWLEDDGTEVHADISEETFEAIASESFVSVLYDKIVAESCAEVMDNVDDVVDKALIIATIAHRGQLDKRGLPYIIHPINVARRAVKQLKALSKTCADDKIEAAALLHDVIEDTAWTLTDLENAGIDEHTVSLVKILTRDKDAQTYKDYIRNISGSGFEACLIKKADICDNMKSWRVFGDEKEYKSLMARYEWALDELTHGTSEK